MTETTYYIQKQAPSGGWVNHIGVAERERAFAYLTEMKQHPGESFRVAAVITVPLGDR